MKEIIAKAFEIEWDAASGYPAGTQWKVLRRGSQGEPKTILLKLAPGFEIASHSHMYIEHHYVLNGEYESQGERFPPEQDGSDGQSAAHGSHIVEENVVIFVERIASGQQ